MCEEIYGYFTILLEKLSMFIGGVFKLELFLPEEYPMAAPKVCWNCAFTQDHNYLPWPFYYVGVSWLCLQGVVYWRVTAEFGLCVFL
jgi:hypothetical protein